LRAHGPRLPFRHHLQDRLEENRAKNEVEKEDDDDYGHSPKQKIPKLVNQIGH